MVVGNRPFPYLDSRQGITPQTSSFAEANSPIWTSDTSTSLFDPLRMSFLFGQCCIPDVIFPVPYSDLELQCCCNEM
ncbi:unnamed protein product [Fusarium venenatum]|uniref:Uncharacterized protein n=1 Tax=Fusarium venenatum TaxID=56646 RepID=A0A2L2T7D1_9HYPO|nr:uncharacterized protein FVRRES_12609 [Fusarium venenatum]CEI39918.1 unnamed protein product [Fusarium venenatum]